MPRTVTRQTWYPTDDGDYDGTMHVVPVTAGAALYEDPYDEGRELEMLETPDVIAQVRADVASDAVRALVQTNWRIRGTTERQAAPALEREQAQAKIRAEVLRAAQRAQEHQYLLDTNWARCIPEAVRPQFLATPETEDVTQALVPLLMLQSAGCGTCTACRPVHLTHDQLQRVVLLTGCEYTRTQWHTLPGHVHGSTPPDDTVYGGLARDDARVHWHYDAQRDATDLCVMEFTMPPDQYTVRVVSLVAARDVLCFRTFQFGRPASTAATRAR